MSTAVPAVPADDGTALAPADSAGLEAASTPALEALALVVAAKAGAAARTGQQQMAREVEATLAAGGVALCEAGTGTGKTYSYLIPAVLHATSQHETTPGEEGQAQAPRAVVIATATKALQEQLVDKDLPFLVDVLAAAGHRFTYAMLKGRSNYLCQARWAEKLGDADPSTGTGAGVVLDTLTDSAGQTLLDAGQVRQLRTWVAGTDTGDRAEVDVPDRAWRELSVTAEECPGKRACPFSDDCFVYAARERAATADVVVANTALYGAHLASGGRALPEHAAVVFDEAHTLENVMAEAFSVTLGPQRLRNLAYKLRRVTTDTEAFEDLLRVADAYAWLLDRHVGERVDPTDGDLADLLAQAREAVQVTLTAAGGPAGDDDGEPGGDSAARQARARRAQVAKLAEGLVDEIGELLESTGDTGGRELGDVVAWVEDAPGGARLRRAPVDVGPKLARTLFADTTVVATSATLRVGGSFDPLLRRWGLLLPGPDGDPFPVTTSTVPSPFAYRSQGYLYVAGHLPDPRSDRFADEMAAELARLATAAGGRTLALFTSRTSMVATSEYLRTRTGLRVLMQGDASRARLLEDFTASPGSVLCALASFWTGVDIVGPELSLVTIDKVPFPRRGEPLIDARRAAVSRRGGNGFADVDIPIAATELAQGAGRLIRATGDRGVVALFDSRLVRKAYGRTLLASLPPLWPTTDPVAVEGALRRLVADL